MTLSEQGLILEANLTAAQMLGMDRGRLAGQPMSRFIFRDDQDIYYLSRKQLFERQIPLTFELRIVGDDGRPFWVQIKTKVAHDSDNALVWRATLSDISERKRAEEGLRQSEEKYRLLFQNMAEGFALYELLYDEQGNPADWRILEVNDAYTRHTGLTLDQIVGRRISEIFPAAIPEYLPRFAEVVADQTSVDFETFSEYVGRHQHVVTFPAGGRRFANIITDITERKQIEETLLKSETRYRSFIEVTGQLGWTTNPDGEVIEDLPSWRKFTGQNKKEVMGWGWAKALHPDDLEHAVRVWKEAIATKNNYEEEYRVRRHDGVYRYFLARGVPVIKDDGDILEWVGTCIGCHRAQTGGKCCAGPFADVDGGQ